MQLVNIYIYIVYGIQYIISLKKKSQVIVHNMITLKKIYIGKDVKGCRPNCQ